MHEHRHLVHLSPFARNPIVFVTTVTKGRRTWLACAEARDILVTLWRNSQTHDGWTVGAYVLMPDHVHLFARPSRDAKPLADWVKSWKSISSRRLAERLQINGSIWQADYFDRYLRSSENYGEKWTYVAHNPVRKGLVATPAEWPWMGTLHELRY